jgi:hypothetical protein
LPLRSEELSSNVGLRIIQFCELVDDTVASAVQNKIATYEGNSSGSRGTYNRPFRLGKNGCYLLFDPLSWASHRETPIWLEVRDSEWKYSKALEDMLRVGALRMDPPFEVLTIYNTVKIPIFLKTSAERNEVINNMLDQIKKVSDLLR